MYINYLSMRNICNTFIIKNVLYISYALRENGVLWFHVAPLYKTVGFYEWKIRFNVNNDFKKSCSFNQKY